MSGMTYSLQKRLLDHYLNLTPDTPDASRYLSLHLSSPTDSGSYANEVTTSGTAYARQSVDSNMTAAGSSTGISTNASIILFPVITADYGGAITHIGIGSALTGGTMALWGALTESQVKNVGQAFQLSPSQLSIQFD